MSTPRDDSARDEKARAQAALDGVASRLAVLLGDEDAGVRFQAAAAAGALKAVRPVPELINGLLDPDEDVRAACAGALARIQSPESEAALLRTLKEDPAPDCKLAAIEALRALRAPSAVPVLRELIRGRGEDIAWSEGWEEGWDDWLDVQIAAIRAVEALGCEQAVEDIEAALNDIEAQDLSGVACRAFVKLGALGRDALERCMDSGAARLRREAIAAMLETFGPENLDRLRRLLKDSDASVRGAAVAAMAKIDPSDAALKALLKDRNPQVAVAAVLACGHLYPRELTALARHSRVAVREAVARAIERMCADRRAMDATLITRVLPHLLSDPAPAVAVAAIAAAAAVHRAGALPLLIRFINHRDSVPEVAAAAAQSLGKIGTSAACPPLAQAARSSNWQLRLAALTALARIATANGSGAQSAAQALREIIETAVEGDEKAQALREEAGGKPNRAPIKTGRDIPVEVSGAQVPPNTLDAILAPDESPPADDGGIKLETEDAERLEKSELPRRRKHVPLGDDISTSKDTARLAARALGQLPAKESIEALAASLAINDEALQVTALQALRRLHRDYAIDARGTREAKDKISDTESVPVRIQAAMLAAELGEDRGLHDCAVILRDGTTDARRLILEAMVYDDLRADAAMFDAAESLLADQALRSLALGALAKARPDVATAHMVEMLASGDDAVQRSAHEFLKSGMIHRDTALSALDDALANPSLARERVWILEALTALGD